MNGEATVVVALIVAVVGPLLLSYLNGRQRRAEKEEDNEIRREVREEDYRRQDEVAQRLANATTKANEKLDVIHTLVDGSMTAAMHSELNATVRELAMMKEVIDLKRAAGQEPSAEALAALKSTQDSIDKLYVVISDRNHQDALGKAQEKAQRED